MAIGTARRLCGTFALAAFLALAFMPEVHAANCGASAGPGVDWTDCRKRNLMLDGTNLTGAVLDGTDLTSTDLRKAKLGQTNFVKAGLGRAMLDGSMAAGADFEKAQGYRTSFVGTELTGANFTKSEMQRADFTNARLVDADFTKSELGRALFAGADISGVDFSFANLARADFRNSVFSAPLQFAKAYLYRTRIEGLDLSTARNLEQWQVDLACGDGETRLPEGVAASASWPCVEE